MKITINGIPELINEEKITVSDLLKIKKFTFKMIIVRINGKVINKEDYDKTYISEGDDVQVIHLISGG